MDIGKNIRKLRELKNLTQNHMARELKVCQKTYSNIENAGDEITLKMISDIALILGTSANHIIDFDQNTFFVPSASKITRLQKGLKQLEDRSIVVYPDDLQEKVIKSKDELISYLINELRNK